MLRCWSINKYSRCAAAMYLLLIEFGGDFAIMQRNGRNMHGIVFESARATAQYGNTALKTVD